MIEPNERTSQTVATHGDGWGPVSLRDATPDDADFLTEMLIEAACWDPRRERLSRAAVLARPGLARYVRDWPRDGDFGVIAETDPATRIGAAWCRTFTADDPGFGWPTERWRERAEGEHDAAHDVDDATPEVSLGVVAPVRRRGVGRALMAAIADAARLRSVAALSLSVESDNGAVELYRQAGYEVVSHAGGALTMRLVLSPSRLPTR